MTRSSIALRSTAPRRRPTALLFAALLAGCVGDRVGEGPGDGAPAIPIGVEAAAAEETAPGGVAAPPSDPVDDETPPAAGGSLADAAAPVPAPTGTRPVFRRPERVRALYLNAWAAGSRNRVAQLIEVARRTEINSFVIDIKDASGYVSHRTSVPLAREIGATGEIRIADLPGLLRKLEAEGIWPIARIVIVRDPLLAAARPALAVQTDAGAPWQDDKGVVWLNLAQEGVWDYHLDLAEEVARAGFPEIQWDYVRFPDAPRSRMASARFPGLDDGGKPETVREFLDYADDRLDDLELDVVHTADVFGITTSTVDVGIGQIWERFIDQVDFALPMVYPSHYYRGSFGYQTPNAHPYEVVKRALERAIERSKAVSGAGRVIPWLQDFDLGPPRYDAPEVRAQIQAVYDVGLQDWVLWNPGSRYTEGALEPDGGWPSEPLIRVAGRVVPVSKRFDAPEPSEPAPAPQAPPTPERPTAGTMQGTPPRSDAPERGQPRVLKPDSLRRWIDSVTTPRGRAGGRD